MLPPCSTRKPLTACTIPGRSGQERTRTKSPDGAVAVRGAASCHDRSPSSGAGQDEFRVACHGTQSAIRNNFCASVPIMTHLGRGAADRAPGRGRARRPVGRPGADDPRGAGPRSARPGSPRSPPSWACTRARRSGWWPRLRRTASWSRPATAGKYRLGVGVLRLAGRHHGPARRRPGGAAGLPPARRRHRRDRQHRRALRELGALPRPGRRLVGAPAAQLGRASTSRCTPPATARSCSAGSTAADVWTRLLATLPSYTPRTITRKAELRDGAGPGPRAGLRRGRRRARGRADRRGGPDPQRRTATWWPR